METNLVIEGLKFMTLGMGTVFVFLTIMIVLMNIMSAFIHKFFPEPKANLDNATGLEQTSTNKKIIATITAAIAHHRKG